MSYDRSFLNKRITVLNRTASYTNQYGRQGGNFQPSADIWANVSWTKGKRALQEGAVDAYDYYMVRCDYHSFLKRESRLSFGGAIFEIQDFKQDFEHNEIQMLVVETKA